MQLNKRFSAIVLLQFDKIFQKNRPEQNTSPGPKLCGAGHKVLGHGPKHVLNMSQKAKFRSDESFLVRSKIIWIRPNLFWT